jgi:hypothetical protein
MAPKHKTILTTCLMMALFVSGVTAQNQAILFSDDGVFQVYVDELPINASPQAEVVLKNVLKDTVSIKVAFENAKPAPLQLYFLEKGKHTNGKEFNYLLELKDGITKLRFMGMREVLDPPLSLLPHQPSNDTSKKYREGELSRFCSLKEGRPVFYNNIPGDGNCKTPMPAEYVNYGKILFSQTQAPDARSRIAEDICRNNCLTVAQLQALARYVDFEVEKLKLIRIGYFSLTDTSAARQLESVFRFESSKRAFHDFLANRDTYRNRMAASCNVASDIRQIQSFGEMLASFSSDTQRLEAFRKSYEEYCYSIDHVKKLLSLFVHDREKVDAAKMMYYRSTDKDIFIQAGETFSYNQSVSDLKDFLDKQGRTRR